MTFADIMQLIVMPLVTIVCGGGWFITYKAYKRKHNGEATQAEAEGWKAMQDLYQQTIEDFKVYSEDMRNERTVLKTENNEMREKYKKLDDEILLLKKQLSRQGRKLEALSPFLCSVVGCRNRKRDNLNAFASDNSADNKDDNDNEE